mgnify:CR=1 FL=1
MFLSNFIPAVLAISFSGIRPTDRIKVSQSIRCSVPEIGRIFSSTEEISTPSIRFSCSRGARFLEEERTTPKRVLTTTMRVAGGNKPLLSVRSAGSVNKRDLIKLSEEIRARYVKAPVKIGQIVCELPNGVQMIATESSRSANQTM